MRCFGDGDPLYAAYHDGEWGRPLTGERELFELICLEGFQAGLSWLTVLRRREGMRGAFAGFDPEAVAAFGPEDLERLLADPRVIRQRAKLEAAVANARATLALRGSGEDLARLVWSFRPPDAPAPEGWPDVPSETPASRDLAKTLKGRGFRFIGPTTAYALMQSAGLVNDHLAACPVRAAVEAERQATRP